MSQIGNQYSERDRLLDMYSRARGEERIRILAKLVVLDEEAGENEDTILLDMYG